MASDRIVGQLAQQGLVAASGGELEGADPKMAGGHAGQHRAGLRAGIAVDVLAGERHGQSPRGGNAQRLHGLADQVFAQHGAQRGFAVAAARKRCAPGTLEGDVAAPAAAVDDFTQQQRPAIAQLRRKAAELVAGIGLGDRCGPLGQFVAAEQGGPQGRVQHLNGQPEFVGQRPIELHQRGLRRLGGLPRHVGALELARIGVVEGEAGGRGIGGRGDGGVRRAAVRVHSLTFSSDTAFMQ